MSAPRVYTSFDLAPAQQIPLDESAFGHLVRALRLQVGDAVRVFNGNGEEYLAELTQVSRKQAFVHITELLNTDTPLTLKLQLGQVISKGDRMDFTIQKATELGVSDITPLWSERCDVRLKGERLDKKVQHWQRIAISACEQCGRNSVPQIHAPMALQDWSKHNTADLRLLLHPRDQQPLSSHTPPTSAALLVGPEGGFTDVEVEQCVQAGFTGLTLGPRVLRTETAALATLSVLQYQWGDFQS